jgi:Ca2+/H+ antiporter
LKEIANCRSDHPLSRSGSATTFNVPQRGIKGVLSCAQTIAGSGAVAAFRLLVRSPSTMIFGWLLVFVPVSLGLKYHLNTSPLLIFGSAAIAIAGLAEWVRRSTEQLAERAGPEIGGLLNVTFGNIAELTLALFVLASGKPDIVRAQITGSIIGTSLLGLGLAILVGGLTRERQTFRRENAGRFSSLLVLTTLALLLPALFSYAREATGHHSDMALTNEELSLGASAVLILLYAGNLIYTLVTHRDVFASDEPRTEPSWSLWTALAVLIGGTAVIAIEAELVSESLTATAQQLNLSPLFLSVIVLGSDRDNRRRLRGGLFRASGSDGAGHEHLHRFGDPDRARHGAVTGSDLVAFRPSDGPGLHKPARSIRDRWDGVDRQRNRRRRGDHMVRGPLADRGLCIARARIFLFRGLSFELIAHALA